MMVTAVRRADSPTASFKFFRLFAVLMLGLDLIRGVGTDAWAGTEFWVFVLVAEYAATIRTIPPSEIASPERKASTAERERE
jgi:hypothetical protein